MNAPATIKADLIPALRDLINDYAVAQRTWTPSTDGLTLDIALDARNLLREHGLTDGQISTLGAML